MTAGSARLWLVDDDEELRRSFAVVLAKASSRLALTGSFGTARATLEAVDRGDALDIALIDLGLPDAQGETLIAELHEKRPTVPLLAFTVRGDDRAVFAALGAGAQGYLTKETPVEELLSAAEEALHGAAPLDRAVSLRVVSRFWQSGARGSSRLRGLTRRELEVLEILCTGASYRETAVMLGLAEGTVQTHVKRIYEKLGVTSKAEAVRAACEAGVGIR